MHIHISNESICFYFSHTKLTPDQHVHSQIWHMSHARLHKDPQIQYTPMFPACQHRSFLAVRLVLRCFCGNSALQSYSTLLSMMFHMAIFKFQEYYNQLCSPDTRSVVSFTLPCLSQLSRACPLLPCSFALM